MDRVQRGDLAAQQLLELAVRHELDGQLIRAGFMLAPPSGSRLEGGGRRSHSAVFHCETSDFVRCHPHLERGFVGHMPCVDIWIGESESGRMHVDTEWGTSFEASARHRSWALAEIRSWLGSEFEPDVPATLSTTVEGDLRSLDTRIEGRRLHSG